MPILFLRRLARTPGAPKYRVVGHIFGRGVRRCEALRIRTAVLALLASCLLFQPPANLKLKQVKRAAVFYELGHSSPAVARIDPIVCGRTREQQADKPALDSHITGRWEMFEPSKTLDVALRLQPGSRHVVVVGGISSFDKHLEAIFRERLHSYEASLDFTYLTDLDILSLFKRLKRLPDHAIVLYTPVGMDANGIRDMGAFQAATMIRPHSLWQRTKWIWVAALVIMLCLSVVAMYVRLKRAKHQQLGLSGMLITAQEKERSRLASEIHDDFSQRLALIALELENAEEAIGKSADDAVQQVHNILNSVSEIGADLHTLSHRLHSSTLESLGLVPGVTALCKEFAIQQGIEIDFLPGEIPRSVHPDVALCLFRIAQEGLRNLKKHSGAAKAFVRLRRVGETLCLSVHDEGVGFDIRELGKKEGLGIRSMKERAYLLGGRFEIHSKPGAGTRIEATVPLQPKS